MPCSVRQVICFSNSYRVGASIQFSCDDSYVLQGSKSITCQRVTETLAAWSDHRPICRSKCECMQTIFPSQHFLLVHFHISLREMGDTHQWWVGCSMVRDYSTEIILFWGCNCYLLPPRSKTWMFSILHITMALPGIYKGYSRFNPLDLKALRRLLSVFIETCSC